MESPADAVNALCAAVMAYCARWSVKRAETLAIQAVQQARYCIHVVIFREDLVLALFAEDFISLKTNIVNNMFPYDA